MNVPVDPGTSVGALKQILSVANMNPDKIDLVLKSDSVVLSDDTIIMPNMTELILFDKERFPERSYPRVDNCFRFATFSRFDRFKNNVLPPRPPPIDDNNEYDPDIVARLELLAALRDRVDLLETDSEEDYEEPAINDAPLALPHQILNDTDSLSDEHNNEEDDDDSDPPPIHEDTEPPSEDDPVVREPVMDRIHVEGTEVRLTEEVAVIVRRLHEVTRAPLAYIVQVFFACDGNEQMTLQCLLSG